MDEFIIRQSILTTYRTTSSSITQWAVNGSHKTM